MPATRARVVITGVVQGVYFRESARQMAEKLGVCGWVRNMPDRRVEAVFEGEPDAVEGMIAWAHIGPPAAAVESVERVAEPVEGCFGFDVRS